jgi:hypothetical protein
MNFLLDVGSRKSFGLNHEEWRCRKACVTCAWMSAAVTAAERVLPRKLWRDLCIAMDCPCSATQTDAEAASENIKNIFLFFGARPRRLNMNA